MTRHIGNMQLEISHRALLPVAAIATIAVARFGPRAGVLAAALFIACVLLHEGGHLLVARLLQVRVSGIGLCGLGAYLRRERVEPQAELLIASAGPLVNLVIAACLWNLNAGVLAWLMQLNLVLGVANLLPIRGTDGRRVLEALSALAHPAPRTL